MAAAANRRARPEAPGAAERLWAPWRAAYLRTAGKPARGCIFCVGDLDARERRRRLILYAGAQALVMLNRYPYNNGHLMIAPRRHLASPERLSRAERAALAELQAEAVVRLRRALKPAGFNLGANLGRSAGAGFADHMHWHVVPRWEGDTNFMPVLAHTRVLSQHLEESFRLLAPLFKAVSAAIS
ncbi:MAG TPA: HIT domain-containing protein [Candidatus Binataceae bacterium]|jgi:ATP adenylyltransferase|nr:HIT domain-containing protein [Candidatus Binataceae bacterium]